MHSRDSYVHRRGLNTCAGQLLMAAVVYGMFIKALYKSNILQFTSLELRQLEPITTRQSILIEQKVRNRQLHSCRVSPKMNPKNNTEFDLFTRFSIFPKKATAEQEEGACSTRSGPRRSRKDFYVLQCRSTVAEIDKRTLKVPGYTFDRNLTAKVFQKKLISTRTYRRLHDAIDGTMTDSFAFRSAFVSTGFFAKPPISGRRDHIAPAFPSTV